VRQRLILLTLKGASKAAAWQQMSQLIYVKRGRLCQPKRL